MPAKRIRTTAAERYHSADFHAKKALRKTVPVVFLDDYNLDLGGKVTSGWILLNTPQFPLEASGTSGLKAALNGVPSFEHP